MVDSFDGTSNSNQGQSMKLIKLTHANLKTPILVVETLIAGFYHSPGHACTHVVASGGAIFPASESVDEIARLINGTQPEVSVNSGQDAQKAEQ